MKKIRNNKGVTLAELLAVITIMGIIAAIAIPAIGNVITNARMGAAESDAVAIYESARVYCTVEICSSGIGSTELSSYIDGSLEGTYTVSIVGAKPSVVSYTLDTLITSAENSKRVTYSSSGVTTWFAS